MLESLFLRDFVIVTQAEIEFSPGFCVLSGETGAGKSILLDALGLALGNRSDAGMVRQGARQTEISASFSPSGNVRDWLAAHELADPDNPDELRLRRIVTADGRSKAFINGSPVTAGQLRALGEQLIEIHGQHASQSLLSTEGQRDLLDDFGQAGKLAEQVRQAWKQWRDARQLLETAQSRQGEIQAEREQLQWQLDELTALSPKENEWESLSQEQSRLANAAGLIQQTQAAAAMLADNDDSLRDQLGHLIQRLRHEARLDPALDNAISMLDSAEIQITEAASELGAYAQSIDVDPSRLELVENRVSEFFSLARKLRCEPEALAQRAEQIAERLTALNRTQDMQALEEQVSRLAGQYEQAASSLSAHRKKAAGRLRNAVNDQIGTLGMPNARFELAVESAEPGPQGTDRIEFQFASHQSMTPRALSRVASGGELSRISLAIAVAAADANPVDTLIFDEADAGVGGAVGDAIGLMMRRLGEARQVLAVTHLPQVAARGHQHFQITKTGSKTELNSKVTLLDDSARIEEVARMLGGAKVTATTRQHAGELIALGAQAATSSATADEKPARKPARNTAKARKPGAKKPARKKASK